MTPTACMLLCTDIPCRRIPPSQALATYCTTLFHRTCNVPFTRLSSCQARQLHVPVSKARMQRVCASNADTGGTSAHAAGLLIDFGDWFVSNGALTARSTPYAQQTAAALLVHLATYSLSRHRPCSEPEQACCTGGVGVGPEEGDKLDAYVTQSGERGLIFKQVRCWSGCLPMLMVMCSKETRSTTSQQASREGGCKEPVWCCAGALRVLTRVHGTLLACMNKK